jgi:hypothetical protein
MESLPGDRKALQKDTSAPEDNREELEEHGRIRAKYREAAINSRLRRV